MSLPPSPAGNYVTYLTRTVDYSPNNDYKVSIAPLIAQAQIINVADVKLSGVTSTPHIVRLRMNPSEKGVTVEDVGADNHLVLIANQIGTDYHVKYDPPRQISYNLSPEQQIKSIDSINFSAYDENMTPLEFSKITLQFQLINKDFYSSQRIPNYQWLS